MGRWCGRVRCIAAKAAPTERAVMTRRGGCMRRGDVGAGWPAMGRWCGRVRCIAAKAVAIGRVGDGGFRGACHAAGPHPCPLPEGEGVFFGMVGAVMFFVDQGRNGVASAALWERAGPRCSAPSAPRPHRGQARSHNEKRSRRRAQRPNLKGGGSGQPAAAGLAGAGLAAGFLRAAVFLAAAFLAGALRAAGALAFLAAFFAGRLMADFF